ncbi:MAG: SgcJ/EcaC family oxidoreductase [Gemmataceae bacterium]
MSDDERAIREVIATWLRAGATGDNETVLRLMADDVVFLVPGHPPFGKEAFAKGQDGLKQYRMDAKSDVREVRVCGDWAYGWTELAVTMTPLDGGAAIRRSGHTLSIFQRLADGRWVLARDANMLTVDKSQPADQVV